LTDKNIAMGKRFISRLTSITSNSSFRRLTSNKLSVLGLGIVLAFVFMALFANWIAPYPEDATGAIHLSSRLEPPSIQHPFGTDIAGRDILSRIIFGTRITLPAALAVQGLIALIAIPVGIVAAYKGGIVATLLLRISDVFMTIPPLILALAATTVFKPDLTIEIIAAAIAFWPWLARVVYSAAVSVKQEMFVEAAKLAGKGSLSIMFGDILPHLISVISVKITLDTGFTILFISTLSFLGLGVQEPAPDWGYMAAVGRNYLPQIWWLATFPGIFILLAVLGFSLLGDGLRDFFDVRLEVGR
jgi:peptide/nickel transport system permease protein